jgi:NAD+ synthase
MKIQNKIADWIKEEVKRACAKGVVVGLSGGVDSSVVVVLCKLALKDRVLGIIMPCYSNPRDEEDAKLLALKFNINTERVVLNSVYDELLRILPHNNNRVVQANLKARLRMLTLYYFANKFNYLVAGTGNKSELMVGYFTKYGDGGVDILPLGGLLKSQVLELAKELEIPPKIIKKVPSAGLWKGQTDEDELGITYKELDKILLSTEGRTDFDIVPALKNKVEKMIKESAHKRNSPPVFRL